jgi:hypothetical protein
MLKALKRCIINGANNRIADKLYGQSTNSLTTLLLPSSPPQPIIAKEQDVFLGITLICFRLVLS